MHTYRLTAAAQLLGVSDDTVRRWADGRAARHLARRRRAGGSSRGPCWPRSRWAAGDPTGPEQTSARNAFPGIVTRVVRGDVVSQVEVQSGPHRLVSLMTTESVDDLGLEPGVPATAPVKSTHVVVELS